MNRALWRNQPVFALRLAMARRFTVDGFWLPMARSLGLGMGYGASMVEVTTHTGSRPESRASCTVTPVPDGPPV
jgi:hypothetical protein